MVLSYDTVIFYQHLFTGNLILVGHCLESKCDVANAIVKGAKTFRPLTGGRPLVKSVKHATLCGKTIKCFVTPNIGTPAWMETLKHIKDNYDLKYSVIVYVASFGFINTDDIASKKYISELFGPRARIVQIVHCKTTDIDVPKEWHNCVKITCGMKFDDKIERTSTLLVEIAKILRIESNNDYQTKLLDKQPPDKTEGTLLFNV